MAEIKAQASGDVKVTGLVVAGVFVAAAFVIAWAAAAAEHRQFSPAAAFTELVAPARDFEEHLASAAELLAKPVWLPHLYPDRTGPGITTTMHQGFAAQWATTNPAIAELPSKEPW